MGQESLLRVENLSVEVSGKEILTSINLEIKKGELLALLGPNGSGKSSLLKAIMGFSGYRVTKGDIVYKGARINDLPLDERARRGLGMMFQRAPVVRGITTEKMMGILQNPAIEFDYRKEAGELNMTDFLQRDINLGFSGGELKRAELLQLLASSPQLIFFDEPESGVDLENIALVGKTMNRLLGRSGDAGGLVITHTGYIFDYVTPARGCVLIGGTIHCIGDARRILNTIRETGYEGCITCNGTKVTQKK